MKQFIYLLLIFFTLVTALNLSKASVTGAPPVLDGNPGPFGQIPHFDTARVYLSPYVMSIVSGGGDTVSILTPDPNPLVVKVTDPNNRPLINVPVTFSVLYTDSGYGTVNGNTSVSVLTNQNGLAQVTWRLGQNFGKQIVVAKVVIGRLRITGSPVTFKDYGV